MNLNTEKKLTIASVLSNSLGNKYKSIIIYVTAALLIQFSIFKYFYPFASYIHGDSFVYLETASKNLSINTYMIGYSMFLRVFSAFSKSDIILAAFQYLIIQISSLTLLCTIFYFYEVRHLVKSLLLILITLNPLHLYLANTISSDGLFLSLSAIWFTLLIWILYKPSLSLLICQALILYFAFTIRYNALIYLFITIVAIIISHQTPWRKTLAILISICFIGLFVWHTGNEYKKLTGVWQYSPFAGWQWANNAMYAYRYVDSADRKVVPVKFRALDENIRRYFDSTKDIKKYPLETIKASTFYMWSPSMPLFNYRNSLFKSDAAASELKKWASMGPFYKDYGILIIRQYPWHFIKYFLLPNATKYYAPPIEFLETYNSGSDSVEPIAQKWFAYKSQRITSRSKNVETKILGPYPILSGVINVTMLFGLISYLLLGSLNQQSALPKITVLSTTYWAGNAVFTILASPAALRFQAFPIMLTMTISILLLDWIWGLATLNEKVYVKTN